MDRSELERIVVRGLSASPKTLPPKIFYDLEGSRLFDRICELPEYYLTRAETEILERQGDAIAAAIGPGAVVVELGSGSSTKTRLLLRALERPLRYVPLDISAEHLEHSCASLRAEHPELDVRPVVHDYARGLPELGAIREGRGGRTVVFFSGSTIGNFEPEERHAFLVAIGKLAGKGGLALIGADLVKDPAVLEAAYDDASGVTAEFNKNVLARINRELDADFDLARFVHRAPWQPRERRIEMRLVSTRPQRVRVGAHEFALDAGEALVTEHCYKFTREGFAEMLERAGITPRAVWCDEAARFSLHLGAV